VKNLTFSTVYDVLIGCVLVESYSSDKGNNEKNKEGEDDLWFLHDWNRYIKRNLLQNSAKEEMVVKLRISNYDSLFFLIAINYRWGLALIDNGMAILGPFLFKTIAWLDMDIKYKLSPSGLKKLVAALLFS